MKTLELTITRREAMLCWDAVCPECGVTAWMVTDEAVARAPRRPSGSSALFPVAMTVRHECHG
jgi:hypothetical protein